MYVYLKSKGEDLWTVGFYDPQGQWQSESDHNIKQDAAEHTHWLNGGSRPTSTHRELSD